MDKSRPSLTRGRDQFAFYQGTVRIPEGCAPNTKMRSHRISTRILVPKGGVEGGIAAQGGSAGGWTLYAKDNQLIYLNNFFGKHSDVLKANGHLPEGDVEVVFEYTRQSKQWAGGGSARLLVNGQEVAQGTSGLSSFIATRKVGSAGSPRFASCSAAVARKIAGLPRSWITPVSNARESPWPWRTACITSP